jgi:restriction endonuclease
MTGELVSPADVPWDVLTGSTLEEVLHWLLHEMGAKDLVWRKGGAGAGAPDGGRDLEATFHVPGPTGEVDLQRWWIEAKGRKNTVEAAAVKEAVLNAAGVGEMDVLVVATNNQFSNPTRDWVSAWQRASPRPRVVLWDRASLERMLARHPAVAAQMFPRALTPQGRLRLVEGNFWNKLLFPDSKTLTALWQGREGLQLTAVSMLPLIIGERANGSPSYRPWCSGLDRTDLLALVRVAAQNALYLLKKSSDLGVSFQTLAAGIGLLLAQALARVPAVELARELEASLAELLEAPNGTQVVEVLIGPIINVEAGAMFDACVRDCGRVLVPSERHGAGPNEHWRDICGKRESKKKEDERELLLVGYDQPCRVGFSVGKEGTCPLYDLDAAKVSLTQTLEILQRVLHYRLGRLEGSEEA